MKKAINSSLFWLAWAVVCSIVFTYNITYEKNVLALGWLIPSIGGFFLSIVYGVEAVIRKVSEEKKENKNQ